MRIETRTWDRSILRCALLLTCAGVLQSPRNCPAQSESTKQPSATSSTEASNALLRHAVFFRFKESAANDDVDRVVEAFRALPSKIGQIRKFQSGENISQSKFSDGLTHCFLLSFNDEADREAYLPHPDHKAFGSKLRPILDGVFVIDYWGQLQSTQLDKELKHALFFKFKGDASADDIRNVEKSLEALPAQIDSIKAFEWGKNNSPESHDQGFTHCFMFTFDSEGGLKEYIEHPAHAAAAKDFKPHVEEIRVLDFWAEDTPTSEGG
jgi:hypothetical protein